MVIAMLSIFDPRDLGLASEATFSPRDVATFAGVGTKAIKIADACLSRYSSSPFKMTGDSAIPVGFTSDLGFASLGE